jgi:hypothetical protein
LRRWILREPAQGLNAARQPDQDHAHVLDHAEDHLAQHLVLLHRAGTSREAQLVELLDAFGEAGDLGAERLAQALARAQVPGRGEEHPGGAPRGVEVDRREAAGEAERVQPGRLARRQHLARVQRLGELERPAHQLAVRRGEGAERGGAACRGARRIKLHHRDHALFYG